MCLYPPMYVYVRFSRAGAERNNTCGKQLIKILDTSKKWYTE